MADIAVRYVKLEATQIRYLANGLEVFNALDIVKHESRRTLLGKIKKIIQNDEFKSKDIMALVQLYPNKIRTKAVEQLVELAIQKIISRNLLTSVESQIQFFV